MKNHTGSPCRVRQGWSDTDGGVSEGQAAEGGVGRGSWGLDEGFSLKPTRAETPSSSKSEFPKAEGEWMALGWMFARQGVARFEVYSSSTRWQQEEWMLAFDRIEKRERDRVIKGWHEKLHKIWVCSQCCSPLITEIRSVTTVTNSCCFHTFLSYDSFSLWSLFLSKFISNHLHM